MHDRQLASVLSQHEAAERYRLMAARTRELAVFLMDPRGVIMTWNQAAQETKGYTADEAIGRHLAILYTDEDRALELPELNISRAAEPCFFSEEQWRKRKDGSLFWAHAAVTALRDENNVLHGFSKITIDLTHQKLLEQCTKEKE